MAPERRPFLCEHTPLHDGYSYQLALSDISSSTGIRFLREQQPELPLSGDRRSGVVIFHGDRIVASAIIEGFTVFSDMKVAVHPDYRGQGLGTRSLLEWFKTVQRHPVLGVRKVTPNGFRAIIKALTDTYAWAVEQGKTVPDKVLREMETGEEMASIRSQVERVELTGEHRIVRKMGILLSPSGG